MLKKVMLKKMLLVLTLSAVACAIHPMASAESNANSAEKQLKDNFSYIGSAPKLKPENFSFLMLENPEQKAAEIKKEPKITQCSASNKYFVNCLR
ncbi:MAG: hypothetical protein K2X01_10410 [Cyanobacteria bacterium]|nr:hypothetical protein [Cyanobacteriota bacterium]